MEPFLKQVAWHYLQDPSKLSQKCFIFPNRRSIAFFNKWIAEGVKELRSGVVIAPRAVTINDFFSTAAGMNVADRVTLLVDLYECYRKLYKNAESLDEFIFWGDIILGDFSDIDKYLVDPKDIFTNIADFKAIQDDYSHLTKAQEEAIKAFIGHFRENDSRVAENLAKGKGNDAKGSFRDIWNILLPLYKSFNSVLEGKGLAYEGHIYRSLAERVKAEAVTDLLQEKYPHNTEFVFVGLNALNECEKTVLRKMRDAGCARFCWDYSGDLIKDKLNRSSVFMSENVIQFPQDFPIDPDGVGVPNFNVVSVPSSVGQVKQIAGIIKGQVPDDCAIVLPDEALLTPLLNSIPEDVTSINVTMGYPMSSSELYSFMRDVVSMQMHLREKDGVWRFYHKQVWDIFASGTFKKVTAGDEAVEARVKEVKAGVKFYIPQKDLAVPGIMETIFRPVIKDSKVQDVEAVKAIIAYQKEVLLAVASRLSADESLALEVDFAKEYWDCLNRLESLADELGESLNIKAQTYVKLLESLLSGMSVPFNGEPLKGLQIMGPLEMRALDFKNLIILSANEGMFPRKSVSSSFIPAELRKGFGLPTYEYQDAVWAYYFYRMITRAENVWMLYDTRTEGLKYGEESRYIKQLDYHFGIPVKRYVAKAELGMFDTEGSIIEKTDEHVEAIRKMSFSPSALQTYLDCPVKFYYQKIEKLSKDDEVAESLDAAMIGEVYHNTMRALFLGDKYMVPGAEDNDKRKLKIYVDQPEITIAYLEGWSKRVDEIKAKVMSLIKSELGSDEVTGRDLVVASIIVRYVTQTIANDIALLKQYGTDRFIAVGFEKPIGCTLDVPGAGEFQFYGIMDRVDNIPGVGVRLVDYKSGKHDNPDVLKIEDEEHAKKVVADIFEGSCASRKASKAALQFYIYDRMMEKAGLCTMDGIHNSMYSSMKMFGKVPEANELNPDFARMMGEHLESLLTEIADKEVPFTQAEELEACTYCDFKMICGR